MRDEISLLSAFAHLSSPFSPPYPGGETSLTRIPRQAPGWRSTFGKHYDQTWRERHGAPNKLLIRATTTSLPRSNAASSSYRPSPPIFISNCRDTEIDRFLVKFSFSR